MGSTSPMSTLLCLGDENEVVSRNKAEPPKISEPHSKTATEQTDQMETLGDADISNLTMPGEEARQNSTDHHSDDSQKAITMEEGKENLKLAAAGMQNGAVLENTTSEKSNSVALGPEIGKPVSPRPIDESEAQVKNPELAQSEDQAPGDAEVARDQEPNVETQATTSVVLGSVLPEQANSSIIAVPLPSKSMCIKPTEQAETKPPTSKADHSHNSKEEKNSQLSKVQAAKVAEVFATTIVPVSPFNSGNNQEEDPVNPEPALIVQASDLEKDNASSATETALDPDENDRSNYETNEKIKKKEKTRLVKKSVVAVNFVKGIDQLSRSTELLGNISESQEEEEDLETKCNLAGTNNISGLQEDDSLYREPYDLSTSAQKLTDTSSIEEVNNPSTNDEKNFSQEKVHSSKRPKRSSIAAFPVSRSNDMSLSLFQESTSVIPKFEPSVFLSGPSATDDPVSRRRTSINLASIAGFQDNFMEMVLSERAQEWLSSFRRSDPRFQIKKYFNDVAQEGADRIEKKGEVNTDETSPMLRVFQRAAVFSVWRPTSIDAIRKMMIMEGTGKGLDIKGKSAKKGKLSAFVPFIQIHQEEHKKMVKTLPKDGKIRIFYKTQGARDKAAEVIGLVASEMKEKVQWAKSILSDPDAGQEISEALSSLVLDISEPFIVPVDYEQCFGIEVPERAFWETYVTRKDITRHDDLDTGRPSEPAFQDMNFAAIHRKRGDGEPRAVVWQQAESHDPMNSQCLLMAYEEDGRVLPVVSDFDCFMVGTRGVRYNRHLPPEQVKTVDWCLNQIETILDGPVSSDGWTKRWLEVLKKSAKGGFYPKIPKYGFGDPRSSFIMECAIDRLKGNGAVRHGAECFNYYFPQELDDHFLVISNTIPGKVPWKYVNAAELREILSHKIDEGFTFPLNPKWVLCDEGWKDLYDKLWASEKPNVKASLNCWYPAGSGLRERIETIHKCHPSGFQVAARTGLKEAEGRSAREKMDLAEEELRRYMTLQRAKQKLRGALFMMRYMDEEENGVKEQAMDTVEDREDFKRMQVAKRKLKAMFILTQVLERKRRKKNGVERRLSRDLNSIRNFVSTGEFLDSDSQEISGAESLNDISRLRDSDARLEDRIDGDKK